MTLKPHTLHVSVDSAGNRYVDIPEQDENIRLTLIPKAKAGYRKDSVRVQIRNASGHLRQGPEIPLDAVAGVVAAFGLLFGSSATASK